MEHPSAIGKYEETDMHNCWISTNSFVEMFPYKTFNKTNGL